MITRATAAKLKTQYLLHSKMDLDNTLTVLQDDNIPTLENAKQDLEQDVEQLKNTIQN
jgi:hypothetical protein